MMIVRPQAPLHELPDALRRRELILNYQPQIAMSSKRVVGMEALARWPHPFHGMIGPIEFIPYAETSGAIDPLFQWALAEALDQACRWQQQGKMLNLSVNLSVHNLRDASLPEMILRQLTKRELEPEALTLEITESIPVLDVTAAIKALGHLRNTGVRISLDDIGNGYSSLAYLRKLPVDEVKLDVAFIKDLSSDGRTGRLVRALIDLCHELGTTVVAEGVETQETWDMLDWYGCDIAQGYLMGKPMDVPHADQWLRESVFA